MSLVLSSVRETLYAVTSCCFPNPTLHINRRTFKVIKLLGEGGFSYVYLVQDTSTGRYYALKKILCQFGSDSVKDAMKEVEMYKLFSHENIIKVIDTCVVQDKNGGKIVYIFLPYYKSGNLQDAINNNLEHDRHFGEREMLKIFRGICYAVRTLHTYRFPIVPLRSENELSNSIINGMENGMNNNNSSQSNDLQNEDDIVPFAHRDIKPGNILLSDDLKTPILMDFGSLVRARIKIQSHNEALMHQDAAAQYSTMSYRAPELFDVKTELNEKVDIWSLGCTLYAMAYGQSPFESSVNEQGGSIALTVLNAQFRFPTAEQDKYSSELKDLISFMLKVDPKDRPDIHDVITKVDTLLEQLSS